MVEKEIKNGSIVNIASIVGKVIYYSWFQFELSQTYIMLDNHIQIFWIVYKIVMNLFIFRLAT